MMKPSVHLRGAIRSICSLTFLFLIFAAGAQAQVVLSNSPQIGSSNPVSAEPLVLRPATTPCKVSLFNELEFNDYSPRTFTFTPPADCPGPWAKVVFSADLTVTEGRQYDRSAQVWLNNVTVYRGTTAEPGSSFSPSWHVESDVTDLSAIFYAAGNGEVDIANIVNSTYTGIIWGNAELDFYPTSAAYPAPTVPDEVLPIYANGDANNFYTPSSPLSESLTLPTNVARAYLDVYTQGSGSDEFWYLTTPDAAVSPYVNGTTGTALREIDVAIDGTPAGLAPAHPYIFTGGIDPDLWKPITGAQTLNFKPYRVNLTPFAGVLSNGSAHTFTLTNTGYLQGALVNGNLLLYLDKGSATVTGSVLSNTLGANPSTNVTSNVNLDASGDGTAEVTETLLRNFTISGVANTSQGAITTSIDQTVNFVNDIQIVDSNSVSTQLETDNLTSTVQSTVTTTTPSAVTVTETDFSIPLAFTVDYVTNPDGSVTWTTTTDQHVDFKQSGPSSFGSSSEEEVAATDTLNFDSSGNFTGNTNNSATATYLAFNSNGYNDSEILTSASNALSAATGSSSTRRVNLTLTPSATTAVQGASVTLTATLAAADNTLTPTGYVTFYANGTSLGAGAVSTGTAALTTTALPVGADSITATYSGDTHFNSAVLPAPVTVTVTALTPAIALSTPSPETLSLTAGQTGIVTLTVTGNATFSGTVTFTCSGAPAETSCAVNPSSAALTGGQSAAVSVVVATTAPNNTSEASNRVPTLGKALGGISVAGLCLLVWPKRRRNFFALVAFAVIGLWAATTLTACSSSHYKYSGSPAGSSTLTVVATSGSVSQSATFGLTIATK
jgi:hypothetical protein